MCVTVVEESTLQAHSASIRDVVSAATGRKRTGLKGHRAKMASGCLSSPANAGYTGKNGPAKNRDMYPSPSGHAEFEGPWEDGFGGASVWQHEWQLAVWVLVASRTGDPGSWLQGIGREWHVGLLGRHVPSTLIMFFPSQRSRCND